MSEIKIFTADDSDNYHTTNLEIKGFISSENYRRISPKNLYYDSNGHRIYPSHFRREHDPVTSAIKQFLLTRLGLNQRGVTDFNIYISIGALDQPFTMMFSKIGTRYHLMGEMQSKDTILTAMARVLYKSCFNNDKDELYKYMLYHLRLPSNVSYALENRAPFHWYKKGNKIDVRFNVKMIGDDECAMEISDGIWAPISVKNTNIYMNYYWKGLERGSWKHLSPKKLWEKLLKSTPTESQLKIMEAFLEQNRTNDIVENRAVQLVTDLEESYSDRIKVLWYAPGKSNKRKIKAMVVRGKRADWIITDAQYKSDIQAVSTFIFCNENSLRTEPWKFQDGYLSGPICIDNMTRNSSIGDQFAARALALLNDSITITLVNTIKRYLNDNHYSGQTKQRVNIEKFGDNDVEEIIKCSN